jgi:hypothetical protein
LSGGNGYTKHDKKLGKKLGKASATRTRRKLLDICFDDQPLGVFHAIPATTACRFKRSNPASGESNQQQYNGSLESTLPIIINNAPKPGTIHHLYSHLYTLFPRFLRKKRFGKGN